MKYKRACVIVLDSVGIGELPDAKDFGDVGAHTLGNVYKHCGGLNIPNLTAMGLGNITNAQLPPTPQPTAAYGRMNEMTKAKDTTCGHWEMMGLVMDPPFKTFEHFPQSMLEAWLKEAGLATGWLGNKPASGTAILDELGQEHMETGAPIVYTSADSVFQIAAHEDVIPIPKLYALCEIARKLLVGDLFVGRVIARPFVGSPGSFTRTKNRKDYAIPPVGDTLLDALAQDGKSTLGIGKIEDIFCNRGVQHVNHTTNNKDSIAAILEALQVPYKDSPQLIFANLIDFDMLYGHRNDPKGYGAALEYFDAKLPEIVSQLQAEDLLIITADHGCDPTTSGTDHTREYVPLLVYGKGIKPQDLGTRESFADIAASLADNFKLPPWPIGESFL